MDGPPRDLPYRGGRLLCCPDGVITHVIASGGIWDVPMESILDGLDTGAPATVVEVGANIGASLLPDAARHPGFRFHCIEPVPAFFDLLSENARRTGRDNVLLHRVAITDREGGVVDIQVHRGTAGAVRDYDDHGWVETVRAPSRSLDAMFAGEKVDLLKIDTDGFEVPVLRGATRVLEEDRPHVYVELHPGLTEAAGYSAGDFEAVFDAAGYGPVHVWEPGGRYLGASPDFRDASRAAAHVAPRELYVDVLVSPREAPFELEATTQLPMVQLVRLLREGLGRDVAARDARRAGGGSPGVG